MRNAAVLIGNVALSIVTGVLLLYAWKRGYFYLDAHVFLPTITAYYQSVCYCRVDPIRDHLIYNTSFAALIGLTIPFVSALVISLRWFVLAAILIGIDWLLARALVAHGDFGVWWMLTGWAPYSFVGAAFFGAWFGERARKRVLQFNFRWSGRRVRKKVATDL